MKFNRTLLAAAIASTMVLSLSACSKSGDNQMNTEQPQTAATAMAPATMNDAHAASTMAPPAASTASDMSDMNGAAASSSAAMHTYGTATTNWFGGPIYNGDPALAATAALVKAGGGADNFDFSKALVSMLGETTVNAEVAKLTKQYGKKNVDDFIAGMTWDINDGLKLATAQGVKLPDAPADLTGKKLASALVNAGTAPDGTFHAGYLFDHAVGHAIHVRIMADVDAKFSHANDENTHKILNQAMYDVAQALGHKDVKLAPHH